MKVKIISDRKPWANGSPCEKGLVIDVDDVEGQALVDAGMALSLKGFIKASELKDMKFPKRARNAKGHLKADDPNTPDINEAWEGGKAPKKKKGKK